MSIGSKARLLLRTAGPGLRAYPAERVVFLHVHKCGGNSLRNALREAYGWPLPGSRRRCFHVSPRRSRALAAHSGRSLATLRDDLLRYHLLSGRVRLATGHFSWPDRLREQFPDVCLVTLLREPISHFVSAWFSWRERPASGPDRGVVDDLEAFLDSEAAHEIGTRFVRTFAGVRKAHEAARPDAIQLATERLASVELVGVLDQMPAFVAAFRRRFGVPLFVAHANRGRLRGALEAREVTDALRDRIREVVRPNQALYDLARRRALDA